MRVRLVDWRPPLTGPAPRERDPGHRDCFTEDEGRRLLAQLDVAARWITDHGGDFVDITKGARSGD